MGSDSQIIWGVIFGAIGFGFALYGRRQKSVIPLVAGIGLIVIPYFIANAAVLVVTGIALMALPYFVRL